MDSSLNRISTTVGRAAATGLRKGRRAMKNAAHSFRLIGVLVCLAMIVPLLLTIAYSVVVWAADIHAGEQTAEYMPADIEAYATINLRPGVNQGLWFKDILNEWWGYTSTNGTVQDLRDQLYKDILDSSGVDLDIETDIIPWLGPEIAVGQTTPGFIGQSTDFVVFVGTTDNTASYNFFFGKFLPLIFERTDITGPTGTYRGMDTVTLEMTDGNTAYFAFVDAEDDYIVFSTSETLFDECLDLVAGDANPSLAGSARFQAAQASLPPIPDGPDSTQEYRAAMVYFNSGAVWQQLDDQVNAGTPEQSVVDFFTPYIPEFAAASASFVDQGVKMDFYSPTPAALDVSSLTPGPMNAASIIPGTADAVCSVKDISGMWERLEDIAADNWADLGTLTGAGEDWPDSPASFIGLLDTNWGFNLDEDVFSWMTGECTFVQMPHWGLNQLDGPPDALLFLKVDDETAARQEVEGIVAAFNADMARDNFPWQPVDTLRLEQDVIGNVPVTFVTNSAVDASGASPGYVFLDNFLVIGTSRDALSAVVVTHSHPELSLAQTPEFQWMTDSSHLGASNNVMAYVNGSRLVDYYLSLMSGGERRDFQDYAAPFIDPLRSAGLSLSIDQNALRGSLLLHVNRTDGTLIEGQVHLQGPLEHDGATVDIGGRQAGSDPLGQFSLTGAPAAENVAGTVSMPGYLSARRSGVTIRQGTRTSLGAVTLIAGDISGNGVIDSADLGAMGGALNTSPPSSAAADFNQDGIVDVYDLVWVGRNQGKSAPTTWLADPGKGVVTGVIYGSGDSPVADAWVHASGIDIDGWAESKTGSDGSYVLEGLPEGNYRVYSGASGYFSEYYQDATYQTATPVTVTGAQETTNINFNLTLGGSISGTVYDSSGTNPLNHASITVFDSASHSQLQSGYTDNAGNYRITALPGGSYDLRAGQIGYLPEFYQGQSSLAAATPVEVTVGQEKSGIDFTLDLGGSISGTVRDSGGNPIAGASIAVYNSDTHTQVRSGSTASDGTYRTGGAGLPSGTYHVGASRYGYVPEYYDYTTTIETAAVVTVTAPNEYSNVNFSLDPAAPTTGSISGTVRDSSGAGPLSGAYVTVYGSDSHSWVRSGYTTENGTFTVGGVPAGTYHVRASHSSYVAEYYQESATLDAAQTVSVSVGEKTTGIDFTLDFGGSISGHVYKPDGRPFDGAYVNVYRSADGIRVASGGTNWFGHYEAAGLPAGDYYVKAYLYGYVGEYYLNATSDNATPVTVTLAHETGGIDFTLELGGYVSGHVYDSLGNPLSGASVYVYDSTSHDQVSSGYTRSDGSYVAVGLATGSYVIMAERGGYFDEYYYEAAGPDTATPVSVTLSQEKPGIDFSLDEGGSISGTVRDSLGSPLSSAWVQVYDSSHNQVGSGHTNSNGTYKVPGLLTGSYVVKASSPGYFDEYYQETSTPDSATPVSVSLNNVTTDVNFTLEKSGSISGTVRDSLGNPIPGISIAVLDTNTGSYVGSGYTNSSGQYKAGGLRSGQFKVYASGGGYIPEYYQDKTALAEATPVSVTLGQDTAGIDFTLATGGSISGTVRDSLGNPIPGISIAVLDANTGSYVGSGYTNSSGQYKAGGLGAGQYKVYANGGSYIPEYYQDKTTFAEATPVSVTTSQETTGIDFTLSMGGSISGTVRDSLGNPIPGISIAVFDANTGSYVAWGYTNSNGQYKAGGLSSTGQYKVYANGGSYIPEYYQDKTSLAEATPVTVTVPLETTGIDFTLELGGSISGTVRDSQGNPISGITVAVYDASTGFTVAWSSTNSSGQYKAGGLGSTGQYKVYATGTGYVAEFYLDKTSLAEATLVSVTVPQETTGIDFTLALAP